MFATYLEYAVPQTVQPSLTNFLYTARPKSPDAPVRNKRLFAVAILLNQPVSVSLVTP
jgi:hypothetical protein